MKRCFFILLPLILSSCLMDKSIDKRDIKIYNKSKEVVYCLMSESNNFRQPYIDYPKSIFEDYYKIEIDSFILLYDKPLSWEEFINDCENSKMKLFFISKDTVVKYDWDEVLTNGIYTDMYKVGMQDIKNNKWEITYLGK